MKNYTTDLLKIKVYTKCNIKITSLDELFEFLQPVVNPYILI